MFGIIADLGQEAALIMIAASAGTSFITAAFGIGGGVLLLAIMGILMPTDALIPIHGIVQIGSNAGRVAIMIRHVAAGVLVPFCLGSLAGAALGGSLAVQLPPSILKIGLGIFILISVWKQTKASASQGSIIAVGAFSSFLTMFFGATGTFVSAMVKTLGLGRLEHVATHSACMTAQHTIKVIAFGLLGFAYAPYAGFIAAMIVSGFIGTLIGRNVLAKMKDANFHHILKAILTVLALRLIYEGWTLI